MNCLCRSFIDVEIPPKVNPQYNCEENYKSCCSAHSLIFEFNVTLEVPLMLLVDVSIPKREVSSAAGGAEFMCPPGSCPGGVPCRVGDPTGTENFEQPLSPPNSAS
jgi:hypothetical protein